MKHLFLLACLSLLLGCQTNSNDIKPTDLRQDEDKTNQDSTLAEIENIDLCNLWRKERTIVEELQEVDGKIIQLKKCDSNWVLTGSSGVDVPGREYNYLNPCKFPDAFKKDGAEIILSGNVYGMNEDESLLSFCAQPFEITEIKFKK